MEPLEVARLEERRQAVGTAEVADEAEAIAGGMMAYSGPGSWTNQAAGLGLDGPVSAADLDRLDAFYVARGAEPRIVVCTYADESLVRGLTARGYTVREIEHVFVRNTTDDTVLPFGWPEGVVIGRLEPGDMKAFIEVSTIGFRPPNEPVPENLYRVTERFAKHPRVTSYLAKADGVPVAGGCVEVAGATSCLMGTSVLPAYRRRGIQQALISVRVVEAKRLGAKFVAIDARPGIPTERNARRMGFQLGYVKLSMARAAPGLEASP